MELKNCPFCGREVVMKGCATLKDGPYYYVDCECGGNTMGAETKEAAAENWNRRAEGLPSAQPERDIPVKPTETTDKAWGIPLRQAVCPKCDYYLGHVAFLGDYKGKRITYCDTCGQAIDWEGWDFDE